MVFGSRPGSSLVLPVLRGALLAGSYCPLPPFLHSSLLLPFLRSRLLNCHFLARCSPEPEAQLHLHSLPKAMLFFESKAAIQLLEWRTIDGNGRVDNTIRYPVWPAHSQSPHRAAQTQPSSTELAIHDLPFCKFRLAVEEGSES